jgi:hypothetical protein
MSNEERQVSWIGTLHVTYKAGDTGMIIPEYILARMTPELVASELESIARQIRDGQVPDQVKPIDEVDILHLRQIAEWLEQRYGTSKETIALQPQAKGQQQ